MSDLNFEFLPGYYEWNLFCNDNVICSSEDYSEIMEGLETYTDVEGVAELTVECWIETDKIIDEIDILDLKGTSLADFLNANKDEIIKVVTKSLCRHYDIPDKATERTDREKRGFD